MYLNVDFEGLYAAVRRMGADSVAPDLVVRRGMAKIDPIDIQLEEGIQVNLSEVGVTSNGLFIYRERQVLLYIQDHGTGVQDALDSGDSGRKFHVAYCRTLEEMHSRGRYERYVATNDLSGEFYITGYDFDSRERIDGKTRLKVCKNCLGKLNYRHVGRTRDQTVAAFDLEVFFDKYKSFFPHMPRRRAGQFDGQYTADWGEVSRRYKETKDFTCESCRLDLRNAPHLLHVHHINGVKTNNSPANLKALCIQCHSQQPDHSRIPISDENAQRIDELRWEQGWRTTVP